MKRLSLLLAITLFLFSNNFGQSDNKNLQFTEKVEYNTWLAGVKVGVMIPYCDIMDYDFFPSNPKSYQFGWSAFVNKQISPFVGLQAQFTSGKLFAEKTNRYFNSTFIQYGVNSYFSITDLIFTKIHEKKINLFFLIGIGLMDFRSILYKNDIPDAEEGYTDIYLEKGKATSEFVVPVTIGANFKLSKSIDLNIETSLNNLVSSDKLDVTKELRNDKYGYTSIGISFKIGDSKNYHLAWISSKEKQQFEEKLAKQNLTEIELLMDDTEFLARKVAYLDSIINAKPPIEEDEDNDGVPNIKDLEPNTPSNYISNFQGIGISITDTIVETDTLINKNKELLFSIYFDFNNFEVKPEYNMQLAEVAKKLKANPLYKIEIRGHADKVGNEAYNRELSKKRTQAVANKLIESYNIIPDRLMQTFKGEDDQLSAEDDYINRRVDFIILKSQP